MKLASVLLLALLSFGLYSFSNKDADEIKFYTSLDEAQKVAEKENKLIFMDAFATWCGPCKKMDASVFKNKDVAAYFNENFVNVKMDIEKNEGPAIQQKYKIRSVPTLLFMSTDGTVKHRAIGFMSSDDFLKLGKEVIKKN